MYLNVTGETRLGEEGFSSSVEVKIMRIIELGQGESVKK